MVLLCLNQAFSCVVEYNDTSNVIIYDSIESYGLNADCNLTLYYNNTFNQSGWMIRNGLSYKYDAGVLKDGIYIASEECNISNSTFIGECKFSVNNNQVLINNMSEGLEMFGIYLVLVAIAVIYMFAAFKVHEDHIIARYVLFFGAIINIAADGIIVYYDSINAAINMPLLYLFEGNLMILLILISYFMIHILKKSYTGKENNDWV